MARPPALRIGLDYRATLAQRRASHLSRSSGVESGPANEVHFEEGIDVYGGAPSGVFDVVAAVGAQQIVGEGAQTRDDVGVLSNALSGLLEAVSGAPFYGETNLPVIAAASQMAVDDLFPIAETLQMLRLA